MCYTQSRFKALLSACVLSLIATAGWSQSLTWLGTLGGNIARLMVFPPTAPWWSAGLTTPQGLVVPFAGRLWWDARPRHAGRRLERAYGVSADGSVVVGWAWNAAGGSCLSLDGGGWDARPRHAGRRL
jgi:uncharacterized membrane protein